MATLTIRLLGSPEITVGEQPLSFRTRKALALLVYLIVEGEMHSREALMALLWPESPAQKASIALRVTLSRLRKALEPAEEVLITAEGKIGFDFSCAIDLDLSWLSTVVLPETPADQLSSILDFDRGEFLAGFSLPDAPDFDHWAVVQREACQRQVETVYDRLTKHQLANYQSAAAVETAARWLARAPLSEAAYRHLMAGQALAGDRPAALQTYERCREMLQREFDLEPSRETADLAENISHDRVRHALESTAAQQGAGEEQATGPANRAERRGTFLPFEGRAEEHSQLVATFRQIEESGARAVSLIGAAGVGKTRLLNAFQAWVSLESTGVEIWQGRAFETGGRLPYQPVIEAMRARLEQENAPEDLLDDVWLAELSQLMPELRARYPDLPAPMTGDASFMRSRLFAAIAALGSALAARVPAVLILDDMQWADAETRDLVHYAVRSWAESGTPILLLLAVRQENYAADSGLREWLTRIERDLPLTRLLMEPLGGAAVGQIVSRLADPATRAEATSAFGAWLWAETRGLPFFVEALLQMLVEQGILGTRRDEGELKYDFEAALGRVDSLAQIPVPPGVKEVILARVERLSAEAAALLLAAAVLGRECSFERLCQVAGAAEEEALAAVEELLNLRLLVEARKARRPYTVAHDYIREVVYGESHEARRRVFHRRALLALEANRAPAAECAFHALASQLDEPAFRFSVSAGDEALRANAYQESLAHYERARDAARRMIDASDSIDSQALRRLYKNRGRALALAEDYPAAQANYQEMLELAAEREDRKLELAALLAQCTLHATHTPMFNPHLGKGLGLAALELARNLNNREAESAALGGLMFAALYGGEDNRITLAYGEASMSIARELGLKEQVGSLLIHLCWPYIAQKQLGAALEASREAEAVWRELGNLPKLIETFEMRQFLYKLANEPEQQIAASSELHRLSRSIGNRLSEGNSVVMMGDVDRLQGSFAETLTTIRAGLAIINFRDNPIWKQAECYFRMDLYLAAGDLVRAEHWADQMYTMQASLTPFFQSAYLDRIARVKIACGKLGEGEAILDRALELCSPDNTWSHFVIWIAITDAYLQLALGSPERAFNRLEERVGSHRQAGFRCQLAEELWLRGRVRLALGEVEAAQELLLEAKTTAEEKGERLYLWQILATLGDLEEMRGDKAEADAWRVQAGEIIRYIADHAGDEEDLRASFLAQPAVARVLGELQDHSRRVDLEGKMDVPQD